MHGYPHGVPDISTATKLAGFAGVLALAFGGAAAAGDAFGPDPELDRPAMSEHDSTHDGSDSMTTATHHESAADPVRGLAVAEHGLRLVVDTPELARETRQELSFRIVDDRGATVRDFDVEHEKRMHLIVARRDLTGFQHLHPVQRDDGTWTTKITLPAAGSYRMFADFSHEDTPTTLASDLRVDGDGQLEDLPAPATRADTGDGYEVALAAPAATAGEPADLRFTITRDGVPVQVEPYLGAGGHLVALREGDLAFLHVHPTDDDDAAFAATFPTVGRYRLFLQFKHAGAVHIAAFTKVVE